MERRVIKINLVGLICTVILIISAIVGIIVFAVTRNKNDNSNNNNNNNTNNSNQTQAPQEEPAKIENNEPKMQIMVNGEKQELSVKTYISELNYRMDYAKDLIYVDSKTNNSESYKFVETDDISMNVTRFDDGFVNKSSDIISSEAKKIKEDSTYRLETINLNGRLCYIEKYNKNDDLYMEYYIENGKSYYEVKIKIGKDYIEKYQQILEKMMLTFNVVYR